MLLDLAVIAIAIAAALVSAFIVSAIKGAQLLVPLDPANPVPEKGAPRFRFSTLGEIRNDHTAWKARGLLALILFVLFALLGKVLIANFAGETSAANDWTLTLRAMAVIVGVGLLVIASLVNVIVVAVMTVLPLAIVEYLTGGVSQGARAMMWMGLAGGMVHLYAGIYLSLNWRSLIYRTRLELRNGETVRGHRVGGIGRFWLLTYLWGLRLMPVAILYQAIVYWAPGLELMNLISNRSLPPAVEIAIGSLSLGIALNIALFIVPMFRELMEKTNLQAAADFSKAVEKRQQMLANHEEIKEDADPVKDFVGKKGQWLTFQQDQLTPFVLVVAALIINSVGQTLAKGVASGLVSDTAGGVYPSQVAAVMSAMSFCINAMFLLGTASMLETEEKKEKKEEAEKFTRRMVRELHDGESFDPTDEDIDSARVNALVGWEAARNADLVVTCSDIGGDPRVLIVERESAPAGDADQGGQD